MTLRYVCSFVSALFVTFGVFLFMQSLVTNSRTAGRRDTSAVAIDFARTVPETKTQTKDRVLPEKIPTRPPPAPLALSVASVTSLSIPTLPRLVPRITGGPQLAGGFDVGKPASDTEALPLVRIEPIYPSMASARGIEGWVTLVFTISPTGNVEGIRVKSAKPKGVFDSTAVRAVQKWKYRPRTVDGKAVSRPDVEVTLDFKIEE